MASSQPTIPSYTITRREDLSLQFNPPVGSLELANALSFSFPLEQSLSDQMKLAMLQYFESEKNCQSCSNTTVTQHQGHPPTPIGTHLQHQEHAPTSISTHLQHQGSPPTSVSTHLQHQGSPPTSVTTNLQHQENTPNSISSSNNMHMLPQFGVSANQPDPPPTIWSFTPASPTHQKRRKSQYDPLKRRKVAAVRKQGACANHRAKKMECKCFSSSTTSVGISMAHNDSQAASDGLPSSRESTRPEMSFQPVNMSTR